VAASELPAADPHERLQGSTRSLAVRTLDRLGDLAARPGDSHDERLRQGTLIFASVLIAVLSSIWVLTYFAFGYPTSAAIPALYQVLTAAGLGALSRTRRFDVFRTTQLVAFLVLPAGTVRTPTSQRPARGDRRATQGRSHRSTRARTG
jgi:hypothetical protein